MLEVQKAKEISGTVTVPPNPDLFLLSLCFVLASNRECRISPVEDTPLVSQYKYIMKGLLDFRKRGATCTARPARSENVNPIPLSFDDLPYRDFIAFFLLGQKRVLTFSTLSQRCLDIWQQKALQFGCAIHSEQSDNITSLCLSSCENFAVSEDILDPNSVNCCIGLAMGMKKKLSVNIEHQFQSPVRHLCTVFGYEVLIKSNLERRSSDTLSRQLRFVNVKQKKQTDNKQSFTVEIDFSTEGSEEVTIDLPGDDILAAILFTAKSLVQKGNLVINNVSLEPWCSSTLNFLRKMQCTIGTQEEVKTSFGSTGAVTLQKFKLYGRKMDCIPLYHFRRQLPVMVILSNFANGQSVFRGLEELRCQDKGNFDCMLACIKLLGGRHGEMPDGIVIDGAKQYDGFDLLETYSAGIAGASAVAGLKCNGKTTVEDGLLLERWPEFKSILDSICK